LWLVFGGTVSGSAISMVLFILRINVDAARDDKRAADHGAMVGTSPNTN